MIAKESTTGDLPRVLTRVNLDSYDYIVVSFSGGKDSLACILHLLELGVPKSKIELWHHLVDGHGDQMMDWPVTRSYVKAVADALDLPVYFAWREEGYRGELMRENAMSHDIVFESPNGLMRYQVKRAKIATRKRFPALHATNLNLRWCTSILKIEVGRLAITHQDRFNHHKMLFVTGERAEESWNRANYQCYEIHWTPRPSLEEELLHEIETQKAKLQSLESVLLEVRRKLRETGISRQNGIPGEHE